jgi:hypothetical protein
VSLLETLLGFQLGNLSGFQLGNQWVIQWVILLEIL